jgi:hypothetical protein
MKKLFLVTMLCLTFAIPAKADFWKKMKNAVLGPGSSTSKSNTSEKTGGTRGYLNADKRIVNPFNKNDFRGEYDIYSAERDAIYKHRNLQGTSTKINYVECRMRAGDFLGRIGYETFYGYVKFPVYEVNGFSGCFSRDKSGKEKELINYDIYLDHELAMYIWDNQLTVTTLSMKNGKAYDNRGEPWFDSTNPEAEIYINGEKFK